MTSNKSPPHTPTCVVLPCGWGRLIFAHTFPDPESVASTILQEKEDERDIAFYLNDPHLVLNQAPQDLFLDPSITFRLNFEDYRAAAKPPIGFSIERLQRKEDLAKINCIYTSHRMVPVKEDFVWQQRDSKRFCYFLARHNKDGRILGVVMGVDHTENFDDLLNGSSLWALAVDQQADLPGVGEALVRHVIEFYKARGRAVLDLSVMHNNRMAIQLYKKLGFAKVAVFAVKNRNRINEHLFVPEPPADSYNPYARIIINEALRRGIRVDETYPERNHFTLSLGGRRVRCWESLSEMTSAVALCRCSDKSFTRKILQQKGLSVPEQCTCSNSQQAIDFLKKHARVVVKPAQGEQGQAVAVDLTTRKAVVEAYKSARRIADKVIIESFEQGQDLRIIVIHQEVVAAAIRRPAQVTGTGKHTIKQLVDKLARRRAAATGGESHIPWDAETERCIKEAGFQAADVLPAGQTVAVRKTANLHTGGTIHDVTDILHPELSAAALQAADALDIPVVGLDFIVSQPDQPDYVIIEANERPGLANHEPMPTAERFIDFLFPQTARPRASSPKP